MDNIVSRGNMMAAYSLVVSNKGAAGVDKMPVTALKGFLQTKWPRIMTRHHKPRLVVAKKAVHRFEANLKIVFRQGRGKNIKKTIEETAPKIRGGSITSHTRKSKECLMSWMDG